MEFDLVDDFLFKDFLDSAYSELMSNSIPEFSDLVAKIPEPEMSDCKTRIPVVGCNCLRTKCIKLYCECFANGNFCGKGCKCKNCNNNERFESRNKARTLVLEKNPTAFVHSRLTGTRGCNCKRSGCKKKYCECFLNGIGCSALCRCENCLNMNVID
jgi:hypothetical protein